MWWLTLPLLASVLLAALWWWLSALRAISKGAYGDSTVVRVIRSIAVRSAVLFPILLILTFVFGICTAFNNVGR